MYLDLSTKHTTKHFVALLTYLTGGLMPLTPIFKKMRLIVARPELVRYRVNKVKKAGLAKCFRQSLRNE